MLQKAKVFGIRLNNEWKYEDKSGIRHLVYVVWADPIPETNYDIGFRTEMLKFPQDMLDKLRSVRPGDIVEIDFNRYNRPAYINIVEHSETFIDA